ncbi:PREDICTED: uncharacterized protein LOC104603566 [Nelumbo nucifera]|uniref:E3 ubiquitin-protein ligase RMA n=2 Tax=Nelumbo nucifera TaxID=4432 RepID=A0A822YEV7_NELNU|nr:PREDICTED: uncharacterized protein LOC104603566 [Nelumbo nucifera]DAD30031.1 TPA_asm: hypothetical protein HUJ06_031499 [Nelumbo nucifera]
MEDQRCDTMGLDLNLELSDPLSPNLAQTLEEILANGAGTIHQEQLQQTEAAVSRPSPRYHWSLRQFQFPPEAMQRNNNNVTVRAEPIVDRGSEALQARDGIMVAEERNIDDSISCNGSAGDLLDNPMQNGKDVEKWSGNGICVFECNICLGMARDPVVTRCGHLYCWACLYQWLHIHSDVKECPVCKGEVMDTSITPIYGHGSNSNEMVKEGESGQGIPPRPHGQRIESLRQTIDRVTNTNPFDIDAWISHIHNRIDEMGGSPSSQNLGGSHVTLADDPSSLTRGILNPRGMHREGLLAQTPVLTANMIGPEQETVDLMQDISSNFEAASRQRLLSLQIMRLQVQRIVSYARFLSAINSAERLVQAYFLGHSTRRNHIQLPPVDDRDSNSSIGAVIQLGSQTVDGAAETDSIGSRREADAPRASDGDIGMFPATRRQRLN